MKRKPLLTKRERKALAPPRTGANTQHIHCVACGAHLDPQDFEKQPPSATVLRCNHGATFASCMGCVPTSRRLLEEHDRSGQPVKAADAWH